MNSPSPFLRSVLVGRWIAAALLIPLAASAAPDRTKPTTPTNLRVTAVTATSVALAWNASSDNSGSFSYTIKELNSGQLRTAAQTATAYTWTGLQPSRSYRFLVYARDAAGNQSGNSNTVSATTPAAPPLVPPANLRLTGATINSLAIAWDAVVGATHYEVRIGTSIYPAGGATAYTFGGLTPGTTYSITVRAWGSTVTAWTAPLLASTVPDTTAPTAPVVTATAVSAGMMEVTWTPATDDNGYVGYNVYLDGRPARSMLPSSSRPRTVTIQNLRGLVTYQVEVRAYDSAGNLSSPMSPVTLTMPAGTDTMPPAAPANFRVVNWGNSISSVGLAWDWPADNVGIVAFAIQMDGMPFGEVVTDVHYGDLFNWFIARHLTPGTSHVFTVTARDEAGNVSTASAPLAVTMQPSTDFMPPSAPTIDWATTAPGFSFVDFLWSGATDNVDTQLEYEVWADGNFLGVYNWEAFEGYFGRHRYHLRAVDRSGNTSAASNEVVLDSPL
jgi:chitodextrinase